MFYEITELSNKKFRYRYMIQDGVESGECSSKEAAIESLISAAKFMNGTTITKDDIRIHDADNRHE